MNRYLVVARPADGNPHRARALYDGNSQDRARGAYDDPDGLPDGRWMIEARARVGSVSRRMVDVVDGTVADDGPGAHVR